MAQNIKVAVRARPLNQREIDMDCGVVISMQDRTATLLVSQAPKHFTYDFVYSSIDPGDASCACQRDIYQEIGATILSNAIDGFNGTLFAYGQTGSGKSHTMMGPPEDYGIIPLMIMDLFTTKAKIEEDDNKELQIWVSYLEIYKERITDLFGAVDKQQEVKIMEHPKLGVYTKGVEEVPCETKEAVIANLEYGLQRRSIGATNMNQTSSRSHAVFCIKTTTLDGPKPEKKGGSGSVQDGRKALSAKINLIDLAGSERASKTGAEGERLKEGSAINMSLSALGMVIKALTEKRDLKVPFRASKLTFLLKDSLAGNARTYMMAAVSPASDNMDETLSTLRFASSVKTIETVAVQNKDKKDRLIEAVSAHHTSAAAARPPETSTAKQPREADPRAPAAPPPGPIGAGRQLTLQESRARAGDVPSSTLRCRRWLRARQAPPAPSRGEPAGGAAGPEREEDSERGPGIVDDEPLAQERVRPPAAGDVPQAQERVRPPAAGDVPQAQERVRPPAAGDVAQERVRPPAAKSPLPSVPEWMTKDQLWESGHDLFLYASGRGPFLACARCGGWAQRTPQKLRELCVPDMTASAVKDMKRVGERRHPDPKLHCSIGCGVPVSAVSELQDAMVMSAAGTLEADELNVPDPADPVIGEELEADSCIGRDAGRTHWERSLLNTSFITWQDWVMAKTVVRAQVEEARARTQLAEIHRATDAIQSSLAAKQIEFDRLRKQLGKP